MASVSLKIDIPVFDFDLVQGIDLSIPVKYETAGVSDTLAGASLVMEVRSEDYLKVIDTLSIANGRIVVIGPNEFKLTFPRVVTSAYRATSMVTRFVYGLKITTSVSKPVFEGSINFRRERVKA